MRITVDKTYEETYDPRVTLIDCIVTKLCVMDLDTLRKAYQALAKILDARKESVS